MQPSLRRVLLPLLCSIVTAGAAEAGDFQRSGSVVTGKGRGAVLQSQRSGTLDSGVNRQQSATLDNGRVLNRASTTQYDTSSGEAVRTVTGVNGNTHTLEGSHGAGRTSGTYATASGKSGSFDQSTSRTESGLQHQTSVTRANGDTLSRNASYSYSADTHTLDRSLTNGQGHTRTGSISRTPAP
jgi:hypothetical protein